MLGSASTIAPAAVVHDHSTEDRRGVASEEQQPAAFMATANPTALAAGNANGPNAPMEIPEVVPDCAKDLLAKMEPGILGGHLVSKPLFCQLIIVSPFPVAET